MEEEVVDQGATPVDEVPVAESEVEDQTSEAAENPAEPDTPEEQQEEATPELEEAEYEGKKYSVPKEIKEALMRQSDYTRKTQEVAEMRKALESERQAAIQQVAVQRQMAQEHANLIAIDNQIKQFEGLDWQSLIDSDPVQAMKLDRQFRSLADSRQQAAYRLMEAERAAFDSYREETEKRVEQGKQVLAKEVTGWSPQLAVALAGYGEEIGYSKQEMQSVLDPRAVKVLHKAYLYDQMMKERSAQKPKPVPAVPAVTVKAKSKASNGEPEDMESWIKWRNSQRSRK
jgi:hypothetical protein